MESAVTPSDRDVGFSGPGLLVTAVRIVVGARYVDESVAELPGQRAVPQTVIRGMSERTTTQSGWTPGTWLPSRTRSTSEGRTAIEGWASTLGLEAMRIDDSA